MGKSTGRSIGSLGKLIGGSIVGSGIVTGFQAVLEELALALRYLLHLFHLGQTHLHQELLSEVFHKEYLEQV